MASGEPGRGQRPAVAGPPAGPGGQRAEEQGGRAGLADGVHQADPLLVLVQRRPVGQAGGRRGRGARDARPRSAPRPRARCRGTGRAAPPRSSSRAAAGPARDARAGRTARRAARRSAGRPAARAPRSRTGRATTGSRACARSMRSASAAGRDSRAALRALPARRAVWRRDCRTFRSVPAPAPAYPPGRSRSRSPRSRGQLVAHDVLEPPLEVEQQPQFLVRVAGRGGAPRLDQRPEGGADLPQPGPGFRLTITRRRSFGSRSRRTKPPSSSRSSTPVIDAVVSPVARASSPAVIGPASATMFRQFRSVTLIPIRSADTCPSSCMIDPFRRMASRNSPSSRCRSARPPAAACSAALLLRHVRSCSALMPARAPPRRGPSRVLQHVTPADHPVR